MRRILPAALFIAILLAATAAYATTVKQWDRHRVNHLRANYGRHALSYQRAMQARAQRWANHMAATDYLADDTYGVHYCNGRYYGSNVGEGPSVKAIEYAFERSAPHRSNILDRDFRVLGIGVAYGHGKTWVVQDFCG